MLECPRRRRSHTRYTPQMNSVRFSDARGDLLFSTEELPRRVNVADRPAETAPQGVFCSVKTPGPVRRGDKLYKIVPASEVVTQ